MQTIEKKEKFKLVKREEFLKRTSEFADKISDLISSTMTVSGDCVDVDGFPFTNDGATIVDAINSISLGSDRIESRYLERIFEATASTDKAAGDGTSSTVIMTGALVKFVEKLFHTGKVSNSVVLNVLDSLSKDILLILSKKTLELKNESEFINLATVAAKDEKLGELIGSAVYKAGTTSSISLWPSDREEDYVKIENGFVIDSRIADSELPKFFDNETTVILLNGEVTIGCPFVRAAIDIASVEKKDVLLISSGISNVTPINTIENFNRTVKGETGRVTYIQAVSTEKSISNDEYYKDISKVTGAKIYKIDKLNSNINAESLSTGLIDHCSEFDRGFKLFKNEVSPELSELLTELKKELSEINTNIPTGRDKTIILKKRINNLESKNIILYIHGETNDVLKTKIAQIQDSVKATQYTTVNGFVPGAGVIYKNIGYELNEIHKNNINDKENERPWSVFNEYITTKLLMTIPNIILDMSTIENTEASISELNSGIVIKESGDSNFSENVIEEGIIDSAKVIENVFKNSFAIARQIAMTGTFIEEVKDER